MNTKYLIFIVLFSLIVIPNVNQAFASYKVDETDVTYATAVSQQRKVVYDTIGGNWWTLDYNGTYILVRYASASNLNTWHLSGVLWNYTPTNNATLPYLGIHDNILYAVQANSNHVYFINGTISGTSVSWSIVRNVFTCNTTCRYAVADYNSTHYGVAAYNFGGTGVKFSFSTNGISWTTKESGSTDVYPPTLNHMQGNRWMITAYFDTYHRVRWWLTNDYVGALPNAFVNVNNIYTYYDAPSVIQDKYDSDKVYIVTIQNRNDTYGNIWFNRYNSGWEASQNIINKTKLFTPVISYNSAVNGTVIGFWNNTSLYGITRFSDGTLNTTELIAVESSHVAYDNGMSSTSEDWNNNVLFMYETGGSAPFNITIAALTTASIPPAPILISGKLCGNKTSEETNTNITAVPKLLSVMCIGDFGTGAIINRTGFVIHNYTNTFMSAWATLSIYMGDDGAVISNEHPLKLVWQKTYEVRNNTNNLQVDYYPNLFIPDHNFVALSFSSTEDIGMDTTVNLNTQYTVNQYAPTTVSFLQSSDYKVKMYAYWYRQNVTFAGDNSFSVQTTAFIPIPSNIQAFWISIGMPPAAGGFIMLITGIIILAIIVLVKGIDEPEKVIGILGITAILCASAANLIPVEIGIAVMIFVAAYFAMKIYSRMVGGSGE